MFSVNWNISDAYLGCCPSLLWITVHSHSVYSSNRSKIWRSWAYSVWVLKPTSGANYPFPEITVIYESVESFGGWFLNLLTESFIQKLIEINVKWIERCIENSTVPLLVLDKFTGESCHNFMSLTIFCSGHLSSDKFSCFAVKKLNFSNETWNSENLQQSGTSCNSV